MFSTCSPVFCCLSTRGPNIRKTGNSIQWFQWNLRHGAKCTLFLSTYLVNLNDSTNVSWLLGPRWFQGTHTDTLKLKNSKSITFTLRERRFLYIFGDPGPWRAALLFAHPVLVSQLRPCVNVRQARQILLRYYKGLIIIDLEIRGLPFSGVPDSYPWKHRRDLATCFS